MTDELFVFYNEFVYKTQALDHNAIKTALMPQIEAELPHTEGAQKGKWLCDVNTEFFNRGQNPLKYVHLVRDELYPAIGRMLTAMPALKRPLESQVVDIWYNTYERGGAQEVHIHNDKYGNTRYALSGIYILELHEPNTTVFFSPLANANPFVDDAKRMETAKEGDILLFPHTLPHYVLPSQHRRTTIAFNIACNFFNQSGEQK